MAVDSGWRIFATTLLVSQLTKPTQIAAAFASTKQLVKLLAPDNSLIRKLSVEEAVRKVQLSRYDVFGTDKRVKAIREESTRCNARWEECYRTTRAAVLPPSPEWMRRNRA